MTKVTIEHGTSVVRIDSQACVPDRALESAAARQEGCERPYGLEASTPCSRIAVVRAGGGLG